MKKLKLRALELGANELLTREQLKNVMGGDGSGDGSGGEDATCRTIKCGDHPCTEKVGTAFYCSNCCVA